MNRATRFLNDKIDQNAIHQVPNGYFCVSLQVIYNWLGFCSKYSYVWVALERKSKRIEIKFKPQNQSLYK